MTPESTEPRFRAESWYMPDTTLHRLNGTCVVNVIDETPREVPWLSPDEADAFADALHRATARALIAEKLQLLDIWQDDHAELFADEIIAALESDDLTIAPTEPVPHFHNFAEVSPDLWECSCGVRVSEGNVIVAAERPAEGHTVTISREALTIARGWGELVPYQEWTDSDMRADDEICAALAASSAPADAALGHGEGTE